MIPQTLSNPLRSLVQNELAQGEAVRWMAQPKAARFALKALPLSLIGIPFTAFAVYWVKSGLDMSASWPADMSGPGAMPYFGIPFILIGLALLASPLWMMYKASNTAYLITDRCARIFDGGWGITIRSFTAADIGDIRRRQYGDGTGDVIFAKEVTGNAAGSSPRIREWGFYAVPNAKDAEDLLLALRSPGGRRAFP